MSGAIHNAQQQAQSLVHPSQSAQQSGIAQPSYSYIQPAPRTGVAYYQTTLEPMQMLQAARSGQPFLNHVFERPAQLLPQGLPSYTPKVAQYPAFQSSPLAGNGGGIADVSPGPGVGATDGQGGVGDGGGGGGGSK